MSSYQASAKKNSRVGAPCYKSGSMGRKQTASCFLIENSGVGHTEAAFVSLHVDEGLEAKMTALERPFVKEVLGFTLGGV